MIQDLPLDVLTDHLLDLLELGDLLNLSETCKGFHDLILRQESLWARRIQQDYSFPVHNSARRLGWLNLYKRVRRPHVYLWGDAANGRLALRQDDDRHRWLYAGGIPVPLRVRFNAPLVELIAGGWSFHALDTRGRVYYWGQMDGEQWAAPDASSTHPGRQVSEPELLNVDLPPVKMIQCGRKHAVALDNSGHVYEWYAWGRILRIGQARSQAGTATMKARAISAGWHFSAAILASGEIAIWWRISNTAQEMEALARRGLPTVDTIVERDMTTVLAPSLASAFRATSPSLAEADITVSKLAAGNGFLIALSQSGKVYRLDVGLPVLQEEAAADEQARGSSDVSEQWLVDQFRVGNRRWEYLPAFSEANYIRTHDCFSDDKVDKPTEMTRITHIEAHNNTFFAYAAPDESDQSSSIVLQGSHETRPDSLPTIVPELQHKGIIRVVLGDWHYGALTTNGQLLTWGQYSKGAVGHGKSNSDVRSTADATAQTRLAPARRAQQAPALNVAKPTAVDFSVRQPDQLAPRTSQQFVFNASFGGWHSSALTFSNSEEEDDDEGDSVDDEPGGETSDMPGSFPRSNAEPDDLADPDGAIGNHPRVFRGAGRFRIGYAGRFMNRGAGPR
ncbi:uncharacterized protein L969DRAFT_102561 [Mixia osmundae IAM 14324]|uniref:F-box domain-containing protein n=1 Tax=Mixia osmundae (strain CBS 9802 / IAM 14324 / JCM 22182 / KY 12970) TaxID=764103 RepID=G7E968_MIXOS|nr:uncharacterized protein L969DRAFT_102561 [Mixia osmundae IAM 14324]KEI39808.1 hypothetical protein L969DRAFT_102561 [Mixia osmundae IAM 14324]GAA99187.1 hypothetical protein E5Q_05879 [Mixia osmundae IAM 14324]